VRVSAAEKLELIHLVEGSSLSVRSTPAEKIGITSGVFGTSDQYDFVRWEPMRESDSAMGRFQAAGGDCAVGWLTLYRRVGATQRVAGVRVTCRTGGGIYAMPSSSGGV
jgi:hypothetical protein